jgi:hypothetical protein
MRTNTDASNVNMLQSSLRTTSLNSLRETALKVSTSGGLDRKTMSNTSSHGFVSALRGHNREPIADRTANRSGHGISPFPNEGPMYWLAASHECGNENLQGAVTVRVPSRPITLPEAGREWSRIWRNECTEWNMDRIEMCCRESHADDKHRNSNVDAVFHEDVPAFTRCNGQDKSTFVKTKDSDRVFDRWVADLQMRLWFFLVSTD